MGKCRLNKKTRQIFGQKEIGYVYDSMIRCWAPSKMPDLIEKALNAKRESKHIEFKQTFDQNSPHDWCEIVKDLVAIANSGGGIILFGVDNLGKPCGASIERLSCIDPADIANKVSKYTGAVDLEFEIRELRKAKTNLIAFVIQGVSVPVVFQKPGTYDIGGGKQRTAFSVGTVYFRHGAKSEPGTSDDIRKVIDRQLNLIRKSWLKDVKKVVQAPHGSQVVTVQFRGASGARVPLARTVHVVKDPHATPALLTRDRTMTSGSFMHEEISEGIFDEINNVIDANAVLAKGQQRFFFGRSIYFRIYAERQHVQQTNENVALLLHSAFTEFYAPGLYWVFALPAKLAAQTFAELYLHPKSPHIYFLLRIAILLGIEFCDWLYARWHDKWKAHPQPPSFYWTFKDMMSKLDSHIPQLIAARASATTCYTIANETSPAAIELVDKPGQAAALLSRACMHVFEGRSNLRTTARNLDFLAYGDEVIKRSSQITKAIMEIIGDQQAGDITEEDTED